jgi:hypothetical protein
MCPGIPPIAGDVSIGGAMGARGISTAGGGAELATPPAPLGVAPAATAAPVGVTSINTAATTVLVIVLRTPVPIDRPINPPFLGPLRHPIARLLSYFDMPLSASGRKQALT